MLPKKKQQKYLTRRLKLMPDRWLMIDLRLFEPEGKKFHYQL